MKYFQKTLDKYEIFYYIITMLVIKGFLKRKKQYSSLEKFMKREGIKTQKALAARLDVSPSLISHVFNKKKTFGKKTALRVSKITGIPIENLIQ